MTEEWRENPKHPGYLVSSEGRIYSLKRRKILKPFRTGKGNLTCGLSNKGLVKMVLINRLVCETFFGESPPDKPQALHRDGDLDNNSVSNLRWGSQSDNSRDQVKRGTHALWSKTHCPKGHPYSGENLILVRGGQARFCRTCRNIKAGETRLKGLPDDSGKHGTNSGYAVWGCRCGLCTKAHTDYQRSYRRGKSQK